MSFSEYVSPLIGRFILAWFFASQALSYAANWNQTVAILASRGVPVAPAILALALLVTGFCALALALGYQTRVAAVVLFGITVATTMVMHDFWSAVAAADRKMSYDLFARDVALAGALLIIVGLGPGGFAIDNRQG